MEDRPAHDLFATSVAEVIETFAQRILDLQAEVEALRGKVSGMERTQAVHQQSLCTLADRMTHESLSILDIIDAMQGNLDPERAVTTDPAFIQELKQVLSRRPSRN